MSLMRSLSAAAAFITLSLMTASCTVNHNVGAESAQLQACKTWCETTNTCRAMTVNCETVCAVNVPLAASAGCSDKFQAFLDCASPDPCKEIGPNAVSTGKCGGQGGAWSGCVTTFCASHPEDADCAKLNLANDAGVTDSRMPDAVTTATDSAPDSAPQVDTTLADAKSDDATPGDVKGEIAAVLSVVPGTLLFAPQIVLTTSASGFITVKNTGIGPSGQLTASITGGDTGDFSVVTSGNSCLAITSLAVGASCNLQITFTPGTAGPKTATVKVVGKGSEMATVVLQGNGVAPAAFTVTPSIQDFGSPVVGTDSPPIDFTISNAGGADTSTPNVLVTGAEPSQFIKTLDTCALLAVLKPAATCKVTIKFRPTFEGVKSATLQVSGTTGGTAFATLTGTGIGPDALSVTPTVQLFTPTVASSMGEKLEFTLTNSGGIAVSSLAASISGVDANQFVRVLADSTCTATLMPAASCKIVVQFLPTSRGNKSAVLNISGSSSGTVSAALAGTGLTDATLTLNRNTFTFSSTTVTTDSAAAQFLVTNTGDVASGPVSVTIGGTNKNDFKVTSSGCGAVLDPGDACSIDVTFSPQTAASLTATLTAKGTPGGSAVATLNGTGKSPGALSISAALAFGGVTVGGQSTTKSFTVTNTGGSPVGPLSSALGGADPTQFPIMGGGNSCANATLQPSDTCQVTLYFAPSSAGQKSASLLVSGGVAGSVIGGMTGTGL